MINEEMGASRAVESQRATGRIEAFSDGVFAIAITLLVLDLKVPEVEQLPASLGTYLLHNWPYYAAFLTSFATIGIMWINHHRLFTHIVRSDNTLLFLNNLLLLGVTVVPWPTSLLALYLGPEGPQADKSMAAMLYSGWFILISIFFNLLWRYASRGDRLLGARVNRAAVDAITRQYRYGIIPYIFAFALAFLGQYNEAWVLASVLVTFLLAVYFALPGQTPPGPGA